MDARSRPEMRYRSTTGLFRRVGAALAALWLAVGPALLPAPSMGVSVHWALEAAPAGTSASVACLDFDSPSNAGRTDVRIQPTAPTFLLAEPPGSRLLTVADPSRGPHPGAAWRIDGLAIDWHCTTAAAEARIRAIDQNSLSYLADHAAMRAGLRTARSTAPAPPLG